MQGVSGRKVFWEKRKSDMDGVDSIFRSYQGGMSMLWLAPKMIKTSNSHRVNLALCLIL